MDLASILQANAKATGMKEVQGEVREVLKPGSIAKMASMGDLAALIQINAAKEEQAKTKALVFTSEFKTELLDSWSYSGLVNYERCPHYMNLYKVARIPQESGPAAARGSEIHEGLEAFVRGDTDELPSDRKTRFEAFTLDFGELREAYRVGEAFLEDNWGCRKDWTPCDWDPQGQSDPELWSKASLDVFVMKDFHARVIDYKSGIRFGNEMKHRDQGVTYALHAIHRYPDLERITIEFWYVDQGSKMVFEFSRERLMALLPLFHDRAIKMTTDELLLPTPTVYNCQWCSYGANTNKKGIPYGNAACEFDFYRGRTNE